MWLQVAIVLWGPQNIRFPLMTLEWPEEAGEKIEGKERIKLEDLEQATWDVETETLQTCAQTGVGRWHGRLGAPECDAVIAVDDHQRRQAR